MKKNWVGWAAAAVLVAVVVAVFVFSGKPREGNGLRVGAHVPMSAESVLIWGTWARQGIELAKEDLAAEGIKLDIEFSDDKNDAKLAQEAAARFINENRSVVVAYLSRASTAMAPVMKDNDGLLITNTYTPGITEKAPGHVVRVGQNAATDSIAMAAFCATHLGKKPLSIIHLRSPAGEQAATILADEYKKLGGTVNPLISYDVAETDFRPKLLQIKAQDPGIVYFYSYEELGTLVRVAREVGIEADLCTDDVAETPSFFKRAGDAGNGVYYTALPFDPDSKSPAVAAYAEKFRKKYNAAPEVHAATWYDTMIILGRAHKSSDGTAAGLRKSLLATKDFAGITGTITIRPDGDVDRHVTIKVTRDGGYYLWKQP